MAKFIKGTIRKMELETGFWGLKTAAGDNYHLFSVPDELKRDGLEVTIKAETLEDMATSAHWGTPVKVESFTIEE